jgi:hypothetical protein
VNPSETLLLLALARGECVETEDDLRELLDIVELLIAVEGRLAA